jgi:aminobenzoyl-glutamate utilization protein B
VGVGHASLIFAAKVMAATTIDLLTNSDALTRAREEHGRRIGNKKYKSPIPADHKPPLDIWNK